MSTFLFTRQTVAGDQCSSCHRRQPIEKVFIARADHPDGRVSGAMTAFVPDDLRTFVLEAADYLSLEVRPKWSPHLDARGQRI